MPIEVTLPDGSVRSFPDGTDSQAILQELRPAAAPAHTPSEVLREASGIPTPPAPPPPTPGLGEDLLNRFRRGGAEGVGNTIQGLVRGFGRLYGVPDPQATPYYQWASRLVEGAQAAYPTDPARDASLPSALAQSAGGMVPTLAASLLAPSAAALQYGASQGESMAQEAERAGRPDRADRALVLGGLSGAASELLLGVPTRFGARLFGREAGTTVGRELLRGGAREATQEGLEQTIQNQIAARESLAGYDPTRPAMQGVGTSMLVGGILGGGVQAGATAARPAIDLEAVQRAVDQAETRLQAETDPNRQQELTAVVQQGRAVLRMPGLRIRRNQTLPLDEVIRQEGMDAVTSWADAPERETPGTVVEAETDLASGQVRLFRSGIQSVSHLRKVLREEKAHLWLNKTPEGQEAFTQFKEEHPLPSEQLKPLVQEGYFRRPQENDSDYRSRLTDEFLAKLARDSWMTRTAGELMAVVKQKLGIRLTPTQAGRLMLRNIRLPERPAGEASSIPQALERPSPSDVRESLRAVDPDEEIPKLQAAYPGVRFRRGTDLDTETKYDQDTKEVVLAPAFFGKLQWEREANLQDALLEAGVATLNPKVLSDDVYERLRQTDPSRVRKTIRALNGRDVLDPPAELKQQVAARILKEQIDDQRLGPAGRILGTASQTLFRLAGLMRLAGQSGLAWMGNDKARGTLALRGLLDSLLERAQLPPVQIEPHNPEQTFVDLHTSEIAPMAPLLRHLRSVAAELVDRGMAGRLWVGLSRQVDSLVQEARIVVKAYPERLATRPPEEVSLDPMSPNFEGTVEALLDRPLTPEELNRLETYRDERRARRVAHMLDQRDRLERQVVQLQMDRPERADEVIQTLRTQQQELSEAIAKATPQARSRAHEIRASDAMVPHARAAQAVLDLDPDIREWDETFGRMESSGLPARDNVSENLLAARGALRDRAATQCYARAQMAERDLARFLLEEYAPALREIRTRLVEQTRGLTENQLAMSDVVLALAGQAGLSGTLSGREAAEALRDFNAAISRLAIRLAKDKSDVLVGQVRHQLELGAPADPEYWRAIPAERLALSLGLGQDVTRRILSLLSTSPEFHNALLSLYRSATGEKNRAVLHTIEQIESALRKAEQEGLRAELAQERNEPYDSKESKFRDLARRVADLRLDELADLTTGHQRDITSAERDLAALEQRRMERQYTADFFRGAASEFGPLPNTRRMVFNLYDGGRRIEGFGGLKPIVLRPGTAHSAETYGSLVRWLAKAAEALRDRTEDEQTLRGLEVGIPEVQKLVSEKFTDEQVVKTLAASYPIEWLSRRSWFRTKGLLPRLLPGVWSAHLTQAQQAYAQLHGKVEKLKLDEARRWERLVRLAGRSLGLDPARRPGDATLLFRAYREVAHRLRRHGSGVEEGQLIWSTGHTITPELLTWLQHDHRVLQRATQLEQTRPYGGVRENFPGRQVVRKGASTGDVGLPRRADMRLVQELRDLYAEAPRDQGRYTDRTELDAWWSRHPEAIGSHIQDPERDDIVLNRRAEMVTAERELSRAIFNGRVRLADLRTLDEWAEALQQFLPPAVPIDAGAELRAELDQYGAHAVSRLGGRDLTTPTKAAVTVTGEDDTTAFTQPASRLYYPPSFYHYGTSQGLAASLDQLVDPVQKEYLESLQQARRHLVARAGEIRRDIPAGDFGQNNGLIRWALEGGLLRSVKRGPVTVTREMAQAAADTLDSRAAILEAEAGRLLEPQRGGLLSRFLNWVYPFLLLRPTVLAANVFGGPVASLPVLTSFYGEAKGSLLTLAAFPFSAGHMLAQQAVDVVRALAKPAHVDLPESELEEFLTSYGIGQSLNQDLSGEAERAAAGRLGQSLPAQAAATVRGAAHEASGVVGVRAGDRLLNLAMSRSVIPSVFWKLKRIAASWQARAQAAVAEGRAPTLTEVPFDPTDSSEAPQIREFLTQFGQPEALLQEIGKPEFSALRWWRSDLGGRMGYALLQDLNVASPVNRPARNTLLGLVGWTAKMVDGLASMSRVTPDTGTLERIRRGTVYALLGAVVASTAYYFQALGRQMIGGGIVAGATAIANILRGLPSDPDDPDALEKLFNGLAALNGWLRQHAPFLVPFEDLTARGAQAVASVSTPSAKPLPYQPGFWERPWRTIAKDLVTSVPGGVGVNQLQLPVLGIAEQTTKAGLQAGRGALTMVEQPGPSGQAAALADLKAGTRNLAGLFGLVGSSAYEFLVPGGEIGRDSRAVLAQAANRAGVRVEPGFASGSLLPATPVRKELMLAGAELVEAERQGDGAAVERAREKIDALAQFVAERASKRATELGHSPLESKKAGESAVKKMLSQLDPVRYGVGRSVTSDEMSRLNQQVGDNPLVQRDRAAAQAVVRRVSARRRFRPTTSMLSPLRRSRVPRVRLSGRRRGRRL